MAKMMTNQENSGLLFTKRSEVPTIENTFKDRHNPDGRVDQQKPVLTVNHNLAASWHRLNIATRNQFTQVINEAMSHRTQKLHSHPIAQELSPSL